VGDPGGGPTGPTLLGLPAAKGLSPRAGSESGPALRATRRDAETRTATAFLTNLGLDKTKLDRLHDVPTEHLIEAQSMTRGGFSPVHDGDVIPENMFEPVATRISEDVALIIGSNKDEGTFLLQSDAELFTINDAGLRSRVKNALGSDEAASRALDLYRRTYPQAPPTGYRVQISPHRSQRNRPIT